MKSTLSTEEVASLFSVTETTVKRWADANKLVCMKTPGGHRKFLAAEVLRFAEQHHFKLSGILTAVKLADGDELQFAVETLNYARISELLYKRALNGEQTAVADLISYLIRSHIGLASILDEVIRPAMYRIGLQWENGLLTVDAEHLASNTMREAMLVVQREQHRKPKNGLSAVCASIEGEQHELGIRGVALLFESEGWDTTFLGANTPFTALHGYVNSKKPDLILLSVMINPSDCVRQIRELSGSVHGYGGRLFLGGPWAGTIQAGEFGATAVCGTAHDAVELARDLFALRRGPKPGKAAERSERRET